MGSVRDYQSVIGLLKFFHESRRSGVLRLSRERSTKNVYFREGAIVFASSDGAAERLGARLVRAGALKQTDLELACKVRESSQLRLGRTLVELGYLTADELDRRVKEQVVEIVFSVVPWQSGSYFAEVADDFVEADLERHDLTTENILMEGVRRIGDPTIIRKGLSELDGPVSWAFDLVSLPKGVELTPEEGFVLSRVDGAATASEIAALSPLGEEQTLRCVYALVAAGLLKTTTEPSNEVEAVAEPLEPEPSAEGIRFEAEMRARYAASSQATLYQILDLSPGAKLESIKAAYFSLAKQLHPDHLSGLKVSDPDGLYSSLYQKVKDAYEVLSSETERRRYDFSLEQAQPRPRSAPAVRTEQKKEAPKQPKQSFSQEDTARIHYGNGERAFQEHRFHDAVEELRAAIRHDSSRAEYHRLLGRALAKNPKWRKQAEDHLWKALELNRFDAQSYMELGELYEVGGLATRARKMFEEAAALDPDNLRAREKLEGPKDESSTLDRIKGMLDRSKGH